MLSSSVFAEFFALFIGRLALMSLLNYKHESTPGRLVSSAHGLFVLAMIYDNNWKDAMDSTVLYFYFDLLFTIKYTAVEDQTSLKTITMILHHCLGFLLCGYSSFNQTYADDHLGSKLTRALLMLEVCNPILHLAMFAKHEDNALLIYLKPLIDFGMLLNYFYVRVWLLALALFIGNEEEVLEFYSSSPVVYFYLMAILLWVLQCVWFTYLLTTSIKSRFTPKFPLHVKEKEEN